MSRFNEVCPTTVKLDDTIFQVSLSLQDEFGTLIRGEFLNSTQVSVTVSGDCLSEPINTPLNPENGKLVGKYAIRLSFEFQEWQNSLPSSYREETTKPACWTLQLSLVKQN